MSKTITLSFAAPIDLAIQMDLYMETKGVNRSQLIKAALLSFLHSQEKQVNITEILDGIHNDVIEIKSLIKKEVLRSKDT